jgi:Fic family protein
MHSLPPPNISLDTAAVWRSLNAATRALAELKGAAETLPNPNILLDTLSLQEALASSKIENIVTTQDEAFQADLFANSVSVEAKEVARYREALMRGYALWQQNRVIGENTIIAMFQILKQRDDGYRALPGTALRNARTGDVVYTPPQERQEIVRLMRDLEGFINDEARSGLDPLIKMALIHHQFESIHPFPDGNGRIGRILNVLYLTHVGLLDAPILYLSRAINRNKADYYRLLQAVRNDGAWAEWTVYMLDAVAETAAQTLQLVREIRDLMRGVKQRLRSELPKVYSQELLNNLFRHPYTRIKFLHRDLNIHYNTAGNYLKSLAAGGFVEEAKRGRDNYYINRPLVRLLLAVADEAPAA